MYLDILQGGVFDLIVLGQAEDALVRQVEEDVVVLLETVHVGIGVTTAALVELTAHYRDENRNNQYYQRI